MGPRQLPGCYLVRLTNYMPACFATSVKAECINLFGMRKAAGNDDCQVIYRQTNSAIRYLMMKAEVEYRNEVCSRHSLCRRRFRAAVRNRGKHRVRVLPERHDLFGLRNSPSRHSKPLR